jgi:hypothetical protein
LSKERKTFFFGFCLVVDSLLKGLTEGDDASDMRGRLDSLPTDLENYFRHMLETIDEFYGEETARIFQITVQAAQALSVSAFRFLEEKKNPNYAHDARIMPYLDTEIKNIYENTKKRLNARCRDLLEINVDPAETSFLMYKVDFLHRTVRDFFLKTNAMEEILKPRTAADFDAQVSLCRVMLAFVGGVRPPPIT